MHTGEQNADLNRLEGYNPLKIPFKPPQKDFLPTQEKEEDGDSITDLGKTTGQSLDSSLKTTAKQIRGGSAGLYPPMSLVPDTELTEAISSLEPYLSPPAKARLQNNRNLSRSMVGAVNNLKKVLPKGSDISILAKQSHEDPTYVKDLIQMSINAESTEEFLNVRDKIHEVVIDAEREGVRLHTFVKRKEE